MANREHDGDIWSVEHLLKDLRYRNLMNKSHAHVRVWFRGHGDKSWDLVPGVYRPDFPKKDEEERLKLEHHLAQDFRVMSAGIRLGDEGEAELYFLMQHYRMSTRLLDWTNNALAGLYFAVSSHPDKDGALWVMDGYQLGPSQEATFDYKETKGNLFEGIADSRHPAFQDALHVIFRWMTPGEFPKFIMPVRPDYFDRRITLQRGCFTFHVPDRSTLVKNEKLTLLCYHIPQNKKQDILQELGALGIDDFSIYGDLEHLSSRLKAAYGI